MKLQFSKTRIVPDALTVWFEHAPGVDMVMDLRKPGFAPGTVERLYAFHVLDRLQPGEVGPALAAWKELLAPGARMFLVNDDFEFLCRSLIGGDLGIRQFNADFAHPTYFTKDNLTEELQAVGFGLDHISMWFVDVPNEFKKAEFELVISTDNV